MVLPEFSLLIGNRLGPGKRLLGLPFYALPITIVKSPLTLRFGKSLSYRVHPRFGTTPIPSRIVIN